MIIRSGLLVASLFSMITLLTPGPVMATTRVVVQSSAQCPSDTVATPCYTSVSDAITAASAGDSIEIRPGTYPGNFTLNKSVSIYGTETARTFLSGNGSGAVLTVDGVSTAMSIRRLTFISATTGILIRNSSSVKITNNVFQDSVTGAAVQTTNSLSTEVINNTFYRNANGILADNISFTITNNIFSRVNTAISPVTMDLTTILYNLFYGGSVGPAVIIDPSSADWKGNISVAVPSSELIADPIFVAPDSTNFTEKDFHLKAGSPAINAGSPSVDNDKVDNTLPDIGAYGGPNEDTVPFPVSDINPSTSASAIALSWIPNRCYLVSGYRVYYGSASGDRSGTGATEGASGFTVTAASATLSGLTTTVAAPAAPALNEPMPLQESLALSWSAVPSARRYNIYYGTTSPPSTLAATVDTTSYTLTGLTNGQPYYVAISAVDQATYYVTITSFYSTETSTVAYESDYSAEVPVTFGSAVEGPLSNIVLDFPETLIPYPALPEGRQGCFIATAAYGHYSDPEVQALREFRDHYLLTNSLGRAFVGWYYHYSPAAAAALNEHPALKPAIRVALLPAVGAACLLTRTSLLFKISLLMALGCAVLFLCNRNRFSRFGGDR